MEQHNHPGPWVAIGIALVALVALWMWTIAWTVLEDHRLDGLENRTGQIERHLECPPGEELLVDSNGNEYCIELPATQREEAQDED